MQYTTPTASHVTGSTLAAGAATVTTLQVANKQVKISIERVSIKFTSGAAANFTPRICNESTGTAGLITQRYLGSNTLVANLFDAASIGGLTTTDATGALYLVPAPNAGADNIFAYDIWYTILA